MLLHIIVISILSPSYPIILSDVTADLKIVYDRIFECSDWLIHRKWTRPVASGILCY